MPATGAVFPQRLAVGSLPAAQPRPRAEHHLQPPALHRRRHQRGHQRGGRAEPPSQLPNQATACSTSWTCPATGTRPSAAPQDLGCLTFTLSGTSQRQGPLPTEIRIERNVTAGAPGRAPPAPGRCSGWNGSSPTRTWPPPASWPPRPCRCCSRGLLPHGPDATRTPSRLRTLFDNTNPVDNAAAINQVSLSGPIWIQQGQTFLVDPQHPLPRLRRRPAGDPNQIGPIAGTPYSAALLRDQRGQRPVGNLQPLRITFKGPRPPDPVHAPAADPGQLLGPVTRAPAVAAGLVPGQYQFRGGNEMFGTGFIAACPTQFAWFPNGRAAYTAYGHPRAALPAAAVPFTAFNGQTDVNHTFIVFPWGCRPAGPASTCPAPARPPPAATSPARSWLRPWPTASRWWATPSRTCR